MIRPKPKPSAIGSQAMASIVTVALLMGSYVGLKGLDVPAFASGRDMIRTIDPLVFERYAAPPPEAAPEPEPESTPDEVEDVPEEVMSFDSEVGRAMEQLEQAFGGDPGAAVASDRAASADPGGAAGGITEDVPTERFEALFGRGDALGVPGAVGARPARGGAERAGVGLGITASTAEPAPSDSPTVEPQLAPGFEAITETRRQPTVESSEVTIGEFSPESFDLTEADRLASWMREHPAELPVGVRVHMNFQPSFLTSTVPFTSDGRAWELYLMFNESLRELHIVLVEGTRSIYMIDRGFQEESRSLREGTVRRLDGEIVAVDSRTAATSGDRARDFYNVFLSWWESVQG